MNTSLRSQQAAKAVEAKAQPAGKKLEKAKAEARALVASLAAGDHPPEISPSHDAQ